MEVSGGRIKEILIALIVITIVALIFAFTMNAKNHNELTKRKTLQASIERLNMDIEKTKQLKVALEENLKENIAELENQKRLTESLKSVLAQEQLISQSLRTELDNVNKAKNLLEKGANKPTKK